MESFVYKGRKTNEISFPLGGIGTGCIGLAGNGRFIDWEIFNRPAKGTVNGFSHLAVKVEQDGKMLDARVLNGDLQGPYSGPFTREHYAQFGFGVDRASLAGLPHFESAEFCGEFPLAEVRFIDKSFPGRVGLTAFNPFIPLNDKDSSIPAAFFEVMVENTLAKPADYTVALAVSNPAMQPAAKDVFSSENGVSCLRFLREDKDVSDPDYTELCAATDAENVSFQEYWYRGAWFDNLGVYWRELTSPGRLKNRNYAKGEKADPTRSDTGVLAAHVRLLPGERRKLRFVLSWYSPNCQNYWLPETCSCGDGCCCTPEKPKTWKNYYATLFHNSIQSACYALTQWDRLYEETLLFKNALFSSTIPPEVLDAVSANISILKSPTCLRLEDGSFYGFEGCHCDCGCCEGSCTHVWNYAYALPFLFPALERSMRALDYKYNMDEYGGMSFRLQLPLGRERSAHRPCADGQFGGIIKTYRDWKISGDDAWLRSFWPAVKKNLAYAWDEHNYDHWDADKDGVLEGRQHHTLDMELFGPNSWLTGLYLAALKAGTEMAEYLGDTDAAREYRGLFENGRKWVNENLFNGSYFIQKVDLKDKSLLEKYTEGAKGHGHDAVEAYWNDEVGEIKYQIGEGCSVDQVLGQWHANLCGLGEIFDKGKVKSALGAIYKNNFKREMRRYYNPCRIFCLNDESGVTICDWPQGAYKPLVPVPYSEETMHGFEYQAAIHMIQEGLVREGTEIIRAIRMRYDGERRNPWNEFECGSNYARSMASYAALSAFGGFSFDMPHGKVGFKPVKQGGDFKIFWSLASAWGTFSSYKDMCRLRVLYGSLKLRQLAIDEPGKTAVRLILVGKDGETVEFTQNGPDIVFEREVTVVPGQTLKVYYGE